MLLLPSNPEVVELMIIVATRDPGVFHVSAIINLEVDLHVIVTRGLLEASHVIVTRNPEADHVISTGDLDHASALVDGADHHVTEIGEADLEISVEGVDHVIASGEVDHVKDTEETETHVEVAADVIERKLLILVAKIMKAVNLKSELCDKYFFLL